MIWQTTKVVNIFIKGKIALIPVTYLKWKTFNKEFSSLIYVLENM